MPKHKFKSPNGAAKKKKCESACTLNTELSNNIDKYKNIFEQEKESQDNCISLKSSPFPTCQIFNLLDDKFLKGLKEEISELDLLEKDNDLYRFRQSDELNNLNLPYLYELKLTLIEKLKPLISKMTGIELNDKLALFHARYSRGDYLLCHDDELEGRRIAFILYLVPGDWGQEDGGGLQLFSTDAEGNPYKVVETLLPQNNCLAFFEVSPVSFHQVAEVLSDKTRLSLGGWFHGATVPRLERPSLVQKEGSSFIEVSEELFMSMVNPIYLDINIQSQIQERFEQTSEINLPQFLLPDKFQSICDKLRSLDDWTLEGPPNRRKTLSKLNFEESDGCLRQLIDFMRSDAFFLMLSNLTGLRLHPLAPQDDSDSSDDESSSDIVNSKCKGSIRKWEQGNYTLVCDDDLGQAEFALDARLCFNVHNWDESMGGQTVYIARNEDDVLIKCEPENNALNLVYRDKESLRFVKYVNNTISANNGPFYDIDFTYYE